MRLGLGNYLGRALTASGSTPPTGSTLLSLSNLVYNVPSFTLAQTLTLSAGTVSCSAFSPDRSWLAIVVVSGIDFFNTTTWVKTTVAIANVTACVWKPDSTQLFVTSTSSVIRVINVPAFSSSSFPVTPASVRFKPALDPIRENILISVLGGTAMYTYSYTGVAGLTHTASDVVESLAYDAVADRFLYGMNTGTNFLISLNPVTLVGTPISTADNDVQGIAASSTGEIIISGEFTLPFPQAARLQADGTFINGYAVGVNCGNCAVSGDGLYVAFARAGTTAAHFAYSIDGTLLLTTPAVNATYHGAAAFN